MKLTINLAAVPAGGVMSASGRTVRAGSPSTRATDGCLT